MVFRGNPGYRAKLSLGKGDSNELMKPFERVQLVKVQSGQSPSGQAGSESCLSPGDRRVEKRRQQGCGPRGFSSEMFVVADAEVISLAEGCI